MKGRRRREEEEGRKEEGSDGTAELLPESRGGFLCVYFLCVFVCGCGCVCVSVGVCVCVCLCGWTSLRGICRSARSITGVTENGFIQ